MKIIELICNPRPASFNHILASKARVLLAGLGHEILYHDLYDDEFEPVLDLAELERGFSLNPLVQAYCRELSGAEGIVIFHPDWWGGPPALLKGWIDRVLRQGIAYDLEGGEFSDKAWAPLLAGKKALVYITSDASEESSVLALQALWTKTILGKCGMDSECHVIRDLRKIAPKERSAWMAGLEARLAQVFPAREDSRPGLAN